MIDKPRPSLPRRTVPADAARVLVLFCHPNPHRSRVNRRLAEAARATAGVTVHDLYQAYPDHHIDVPFEQELLAAHDAVVLQHPFYWYSTPPLLKEWFDEVLSWGWAYGPQGDKLRGKRLVSAVTTGGSAAAYQPEGFNRYTVAQLLAPVDQTAHLCGMTYLPPFVVHSTHRLTDDQIDAAARDYRALLESLRDRPEAT